MGFLEFLHNLNVAPAGIIGPHIAAKLQPTLDWMQGTWLNHLAIDYFWTWPVCEIIHYIGLSMLLGAIFIVDLRSIGVGHMKISSKTIEHLVKIAIAGFLLNLITGIVFIFGDPHRYAVNISFQMKMVLLAAAGINALVDHYKIRPMLNALPAYAAPPVAARVVGGISILFWTCVVIFGRLIPYLGTG